MKSENSNVPSSSADAKPNRQPSETETSVAKSAGVPSSIHHRSGIAVSSHAQLPGTVFQRPIRPTQVEPSTPDLHKRAQQSQQPKPPYRPPVYNVAQPRRLPLITFTIMQLPYVVTFQWFEAVGWVTGRECGL